MVDKPTLYGFDGSTFVRTVRMVLADKEIAYDQVPVNVLTGEPRQPEHLARHPFGKVPVLDIDGMRLRETDAICRYLDEKAPVPALMPDIPKARARANEAISLITSYGYDALLGVAGQHLFPELVGGKDDAARTQAIKDAQTLLEVLMSNRDGAKWLAGDAPSLADYFLGPLLYYVSLTPDAGRILTVEGVPEWWDQMRDAASFISTEPDLG